MKKGTAWLSLRMLQRRQAAASRAVERREWYRILKHRRRLANIRRTRIPPVTIGAPAWLSIRDNAEGVIGFCAKVFKAIDTEQSVALDLSKVQVISSDAIAYILSILEYVRNTGKQVSISGNTPTNLACSEFLRESGFYGFVESPWKSVQAGKGDVFSIESGTNVDSRRAWDARQFAANRLPQVSPLALRRLYEIIIECMGNTHNHAYLGRVKARGRGRAIRAYRWWLMAYHEASNGRVVYTFIDNGLGIPATVRKYHADKLKHLFGLETGTDSGLIASAMRGEFRSRTREANRGKGLKSIKAALDSGLVCQLQVISNLGSTRDGQPDKTRLMEPFRGTMLAWIVANE